MGSSIQGLPRTTRSLHVERGRDRTLDRMSEVLGTFAAGTTSQLAATADVRLPVGAGLVQPIDVLPDVCADAAAQEVSAPIFTNPLCKSTLLDPRLCAAARANSGR
jgi:hypothetical protein